MFFASPGSPESNNGKAIPCLDAAGLPVSESPRPFLDAWLLFLLQLRVKAAPVDVIAEVPQLAGYGSMGFRSVNRH